MLPTPIDDTLDFLALVRVGCLSLARIKKVCFPLVFCPELSLVSQRGFPTSSLVHWPGNQVWLAVRDKVAFHHTTYMDLVQSQSLGLLRCLRHPRSYLSRRLRYISLYLLLDRPVSVLKKPGFRNQIIEAPMSGTGEISGFWFGITVR